VIAGAGTVGLEILEDVPDVDTVLFLRPTESSTIFMQQLGRGPRRTHRKAVLTALDFVGYHRKEFHFSTKFGGLTGIRRTHPGKAGQGGAPGGWRPASAMRASC